MIYKFECWATGKKEEIKMKMLRWMWDVTKLDRTRNRYIRGNLGVRNIVENLSFKKCGCLILITWSKVMKP